MITGPQLRTARLALGWDPGELAKKAKVSLSVVVRAENSPDEPMVSIAHRNALIQILRNAGASFAPASGNETGASPSSTPSGRKG